MFNVICAGNFFKTSYASELHENLAEMFPRHWSVKLRIIDFMDVFKYINTNFERVNTDIFII